MVTKTYDGTTVATIDVGTLSGLVDGDIVDVSATGVFSSAAVGSGKTVLVSYSLSGANADDYTLAGQTLLGDIVAAPTTPTPAPSSTPSSTPSATTTSAAPSLSGLIAIADQSPTRLATQSAGFLSYAAPSIPPLPVLSDAGGGALLVFATPAQGGDVAMDLPQLRLAMGLDPSVPIAVPVGQFKWISLENDGVRLPAGVNQLFFLNPPRP